MNYRIHSVQKFLERVDLTCLFMAVVIAKLAFYPTANLTWEALIGLTALGFKRYIDVQKRDLAEADQERIRKVEARMANLETDSAAQSLFR